MKKNLFLCALFLTSIFSMKAQLSGSFNVPGNYPSIAAAINDLNLQGVSGPVTINVSTGWTELAPAGGYTLTASGSSVNTITFQKSGSGSNPLIYAYSGGAGTPATAVQDGIWRFLGSDYITIDGINLLDTNSFNPATMEFGYGFFKASATDGCQNNTIKNCVITLNRNNNAAGNTTSVDGSRGIEFVNALTNAHATPLAITAASGSNSDNKIYSNIIQNCNIGISMIGFASTSPFTNSDWNNDIGGSSMGTGNSILNYGGGNAASTTPAAAIRTLAQYNINVAYNLIQNNNGGGAPNVSTLRGVYLNTATSANASILNNTITINSGANTSQVSAIENVSGSTAANNAIIISNNLIANGTSSTTSGSYYGIYNNGASSASLVISNNTFTNNSSEATTGASYLIRNSGAVADLIEVNNNILSHHLTGASLTGADIYNIYVTGTGTTTAVNFNNNTFASYTHTVTGTGDVHFIYSTKPAQSLTVSGNNMSNLTLNINGIVRCIYTSGNIVQSMAVTNNTISNITRSGAAGAFYGYYLSGTTGTSCIQNVSNNTLSSITSTLSGTGIFYAYYNILGNTSPYPQKTFFNNTLTGINSGGTGTFYGLYNTDLGDGSSTSGSVVYNNIAENITSGGIMYVLYNSSTTSPTYMASVYSNTVANITGNGATSAIYASYLGSGGAGIEFHKNKIYDVTSNGSTGTVYGIYAITSTTSNIYNNLVGNLFAPLSGGANRVNGIYAISGTNLNFYYNTVLLNATSTGTDFGTNAIYTATAVTNVTLRNNIFVNLSAPTGTGATVAYRRNGVSLANYNTASNRNLFYAGTPSASNLIFTDGTNDYQALSTYISAVNPADANSVTENPTFQSTVGSNSNFLNINTSIQTQIESGASPVAGITNDFAGTTRNATTPDIGAWEGNFTPMTTDVVAPAFLNDGFTTSACGLSGRTYTLNLTDASGVASGTLSPRVYYSLNGAPYTSVAGNLTSGTSLNGVWTFNLTYAASIGDVVSYFVVAQDIAGTPNLGALPGGGFAGTSVNNVTSNPTSPFSYTINPTIGGSYNVGTAGTYTTLTDAVTAYNTSCLTSSVTFVLTDPSYSANETFPIIILNNPDASITNSLLVRPASGVTSTIVTASAISSTIRFLDARFITFDGVNSGGSALSIGNTHTGTSANFYIAASSGGPGNKNITLKNLDIVGSATSSGRYGVLITQNAATPTTVDGYDNDFISVLNNTITNVYYGIYAAGSGSLIAGGANDLLISGNTLGTVSGPGSVGYRGIHISNAPGVVITNNLVRNISATSSASGIYLENNIIGGSVSQNTITEVYSSTGSSAATTIVNGIYMGPGVNNTSVSMNTISNIVNTNSTGYGARGIQINVSNSSQNAVNNNMISGIAGNGNTLNTRWTYGIALDGSSGGVNIDFNSVHLNSSVAGSASGVGTSAMYINTTGGGNNIRNNIFANTYDNTAITTDAAYAVYSSATSGTNVSVMDFNNYHVGGNGNNPVLGYINSTAQNNLAAIQSGFGGNAASQNIVPVFTSSTDLHLVPGMNAMLDDLGTPVTGITVDIDGQTRNVTTPDMGADEFTAPTCTTASGGVLSANSFSLCNGDALTISSSSVSVGAGSIYQWMQSTTPGGPYSPVSGGTGSNTASYISGSLGLGTLYYVLEVTCTSASLTSISNEATVSVNPIPTASASSNAPVCQGSSLTLNGSSDIGTSYTWSGPAGFTSSLQNDVISNVQGSASGIYSLVATAANCSSPSATLSVLINTVSANISGPAFVCSGGSATLTAASSGTSVVWSTLATTNSIVVTPANTTVYDVTATSALGCTVMASHTVSVITPTIAGIGAFACGTPTATGTLTANAFGQINWYDAPTSTVVIGTGTTFVTPAVTTNTTFYAEAMSTSSGSLFTTLAGGNSSAGNMFDIIPLQNIEINGFDVHVGTGAYTMEVWYRNGSYVGFNTSNAGWTLAGTTTLTGMGSGNLTQVPMNFTVPVTAGQTYGFCVTLTGSTMYYTNGTAVGNIWASNSDVQILEGNGGGYFSYTFSPRCFNGVMRYTKPGCGTPRIPITFSVSPQPTVNISASSTTICEGSAVVLTASGASTYSWNNGATTAVIAENPTVTTSYTVTGDNGGCVSSETVAVTVNALPAVSLSAAQMTTCVNAPSIALTGSPSGGTYSGSNVTGSSFVPGANAGTFSPVYSYSDPNTGCSNSATTTIVVSSCTGLDKTGTTLAGLSVYPNPNHGLFTVTLDNGLEKKIELTDLTGRIIFSKSTLDVATQVNISDLANGVYFVKIESNGKNEVYKVVKQ